MKKKRPSRKVDPDNPPWTAKEMAEAIPFSELPAPLKKMLRAIQRGPQKAPTKELISIRLSRDVVQGFRATGPGWQSRVDSTLRESLKKRAKQTV